jgi:hypothetical protein
VFGGEQDSEIQNPRVEHQIFMWRMRQALSVRTVLHTPRFEAVTVMSVEEFFVLDAFGCPVTIWLNRVSNFTTKRDKYSPTFSSISRRHFQ